MERSVVQRVGGVVYCVADSVVDVGGAGRDVYEGRGLAQMIAAGGGTGVFQLIDWGLEEGGGLWRVYRIGGGGVEARVKETFVEGCFELDVGGGQEAE